MWRFIVVVLSVICLTGCKTSRSIDSTYTKVDTIFLQSVKMQRYDSIVYVHDSIMQTKEIYVTLDSVGNEVKRIEYHTKDHYNIANASTVKESEKNDSASITSIANTSVKERIVETNTLSLWQKVQIWLGRLMAFLFLILILYYFFDKNLKGKF